MKDNSRIGRNYIQTGNFRELLRQNDVRFIAMNEGTDTGTGMEDDFLPFRDVINEYYAKDISKKIRSTFKSKGESGKHVASSPPYGYINQKICEDQALEKLSAERYTVLYNRYQEEQNALKQRVRDLRVTIADDKKEIRSASKFIKLAERYEDFMVLTPVMLNEFVDKVIVHERDRGYCTQTTQKVEIYFNFIGEYTHRLP